MLKSNNKQILFSKCLLVAAAALEVVEWNEDQQEWLTVSLQEGSWLAWSSSTTAVVNDWHELLVLLQCWWVVNGVTAGGQLIGMNCQYYRSGEWLAWTTGTAAMVMIQLPLLPLDISSGRHTSVWISHARPSLLRRTIQYIGACAVTWLIVMGSHHMLHSDDVVRQLLRQILKPREHVAINTWQAAHAYSPLLTLQSRTHLLVLLCKFRCWHCVTSVWNVLSWLQYDGVARVVCAQFDRLKSGHGAHQSSSDGVTVRSPATEVRSLHVIGMIMW